MTWLAQGALKRAVEGAQVGKEQGNLVNPHGHSFPKTQDPKSTSQPSLRQVSLF